MFTTLDCIDIGIRKSEFCGEHSIYFTNLQEFPKVFNSVIGSKNVEDNSILYF